VRKSTRLYSTSGASAPAETGIASDWDTFGKAIAELEIAH